MADGDITDPTLVETRPNRDHIRVANVYIDFDNKKMKVGFTERDSSGNNIGKRREGGFLIQNIEDDPETPEDESTTDYTATFANINNNSNIKISLANRVKTLMGL